MAAPSWLSGGRNGRRVAKSRTSTLTSPEAALALLRKRGSEVGDAQPVAWTDGLLLGQVVPPPAVAHGDTVALGDGGYGVARADHVDAGLGLVRGGLDGRRLVRRSLVGRDRGAGDRGRPLGLGSDGR